MLNVIGKTAFITGGASGIGLGMAMAFGAAGMKVVIADVDRGLLDSAVRGLESEAIEHLAVHLDVTDVDGWNQAADCAERRFGRVDILCNNAGISLGRPAPGATGSLADVPLPLWRLIVDINLNGAFY